MQLRENPKTGEVFLWDGATETMYGIDGSPYGMKPEVIEEWQSVEYYPIPSLQAWQHDPGHFSWAFYVRARIIGFPNFTVGGSFLCIQNWARENEKDFVLIGCYRSRNLARSGADVEW